MTNHEHERAIDLITRRGVEDISAADVAWLESHLALCSECAEYASLSSSTGQLAALGGGHRQPGAGGHHAGTGARARCAAARAAGAIVLIAVSFCIGVLSSTISAWLWWRFGGWVAERLSLPGSIVEPGMFVAWLLPAIVIAVAMLASSHPGHRPLGDVGDAGGSGKGTANDATRSHFAEELRIIPDRLGGSLSVIGVCGRRGPLPCAHSTLSHHHDLPPQPWWTLLGVVGGSGYRGNDPADRVHLRRFQAAGHERGAVDAAGHPDTQADWLHCLLPAAQAAAGAVSQLPVADRADFAYCPKCGHALAPSCANCGRAIRRDYMCCPYCGKTVGATAT